MYLRYADVELVRFLRLILYVFLCFVLYITRSVYVKHYVNLYLSNRYSASNRSMGSTSYSISPMSYSFSFFFGLCLKNHNNRVNPTI